MARTRRQDADLTYRLDVGKLRGEVRVFETNNGRYVAEYKLGTVKWQLPANGATAIEALESAKKFLTTKMGSR